MAIFNDFRTYYAGYAEYGPSRPPSPPPEKSATVNGDKKQQEWREFWPPLPGTTLFLQLESRHPEFVAWHFDRQKIFNHSPWTRAQRQPDPMSASIESLDLDMHHDPEFPGYGTAYPMVVDSLQAVRDDLDLFIEWKALPVIRPQYFHYLAPLPIYEHKRPYRIQLPPGLEGVKVTNMVTANYPVNIYDISNHSKNFTLAESGFEYTKCPAQVREWTDRSITEDYLPQLKDWLVKHLGCESVFVYSFNFRQNGDDSFVPVRRPWGTAMDMPPFDVAGTDSPVVPTEILGVPADNFSLLAKCFPVSEESLQASAEGIPDDETFNDFGDYDNCDDYDDYDDYDDDGAASVSPGDNRGIEEMHSTLAQYLTADRRDDPFNMVGSVSPDPLGPCHWKAPLFRVHCDASKHTHLHRMPMYMPEEHSRYMKGRVRLLSIWRPLSPSPLDSPLAVCDYRTLDDGDLVPTDLVYPHFVDEVYEVRYNPNHRWFYKKNMSVDEVLMFKLHDTSNEEATVCPHSAFVDGSNPPNIPKRASIEVKVMVFGG